MKKIIAVISVFIVAGIINACCNEYRYKSTLSKLEFIESTGAASPNSTAVLVNFRVVDEFTAISMGGIVSQSKADGTICNDETIYEKYEDPIVNMFIGCDRNLVSNDANENLTGTSFGYYIANDKSRRKPFGLIKEDLNDVFKPLSHPGRDVWLEVPITEFPETGNYKFTMRLVLESGIVLEASSVDISVVR
jgi:hypothetical protein